MSQRLDIIKCTNKRVRVDIEDSGTVIVTVEKGVVVIKSCNHVTNEKNETIIDI